MLSISTATVDLSTSFSFAIKTFIYKLVSVLIVYCPFLLAIMALTLLNLQKWRTTGRAVFIMMTGYAVSFLVWMLLYDYFGSSEFHYYFTEPLINVGLFALILYLLV